MCGKGNGEFIVGSKEVPPDIITLTSVVASLERSDRINSKENIDRIFTDAVERNIIFYDTMDTTWETDLSDIPLSCICWL